MLRAVGFSEEDFGKPQVGVASSWNEVTPCNYHLSKLAALAKEGVREGGAVPLEFTTIAVSDGIAMARLNLPAVYLYGGTILPGTYEGRDVTIQDVFEAVGAHAKGSMSDEQLLAMERAACPTAGSCAGMYTANTMA